MTSDQAVASADAAHDSYARVGGRRRHRMSKRKRRSLGQAMGQAIVGFDYQVFRTTKPPPDLVEAAKPVAPVPAADGGRISIDLPRLDGLDDEGDPPRD